MIPDNENYPYVVKGPNKFALMLALFDHPSPGFQRCPLEFLTQTDPGSKDSQKVTVEFHLIGMERDEADYERWTLVGMTTIKGQKEKVKILYRTNIRKGKITKY